MHLLPSLWGIVDILLLLLRLSHKLLLLMLMLILMTHCRAIHSIIEKLCICIHVCLRLCLALWMKKLRFFPPNILRLLAALHILSQMHRGYRTDSLCRLTRWLHLLLRRSQCIKVLFLFAIKIFLKALSNIIILAGINER